MIRKTTALFATLALGVAFGAFAVTCPGPDAYGYTCQDIPCADTPTSSTLSMGDDTCSSRSTGFSFNFYGATYSGVGVSSNGYIIMGSCASGDGTDFSNDCPVPSTIDPDNAVFGVWDDINPGSGGVIRDGTSGSAPNRVYTVDFNGVPYFSGAGSVSFQIQLHENGGPPNDASVRVRVRNDNQGSFTSGLENLNGTDGISRHCNSGPVTTVQCTEYSTAPAPPSGDCDLTPVLNLLFCINDIVCNDLPGRLDDLDEGQQDILDEIADLSDQVAGLEGTVASLQATVCEVIRLLHTPQGNRTSSTDECGDFTWNGGEREICDDGLDNDFDGLTDCDDPDCEAACP